MREIFSARVDAIPVKLTPPPPLTSPGPLFRFESMSVSGSRATPKLRRVVSALALIFVFFLPLHFHFSLGAQLNKECSCLQGARTQLAPSTAIQTIIPHFPAVPIASPRLHAWMGRAVRHQQVRAPPVSVSL